MSYDTKDYISACLFLRAHWKKYHLPLNAFAFRQRYNQSLMKYFISEKIIVFRPECFIDWASGKPIPGLELTFKGLWIIFKVAEKRISK